MEPFAQRVGWFSILTPMQECHNIIYGQERALQAEEFLHVEARVLDADAFQRRADVEEVLVGESLAADDAHHLYRLLHLPADVVEIGGKCHFTNHPLAQRTEAQCREPTPHLVEPDLLFVCVWIYHFVCKVTTI